MKFKPLLLLVLISLAYTPATYTITVDVYQNMESGNDGVKVTSDIMEASCYGGIDGRDATWALWEDSTDSGSMWISTSFARQLPGIVTVNGKDYTGSSSRTWRFLDRYDKNSVVIFYGTGENSPYPPYHDRLTVACYYTPGQDKPFWNGHDIIAVGCAPGTEGFAVLQINGKNENGEQDGPYIYAHAEAADGVSTGSPTSIKVVAGKTYWVNLHHNGPEGKCYVVVFDPDNGWTQTGIIVAESTPGSKAYSRIRFGRCDSHQDNLATLDGTHQSYISHILIDYSTAAFPLLPDNVQIKNLHYKKNAINPQLSIYPNPSRGSFIIELKNVSPALMVGSKLKIYDLSGRLADELKPRDGKFLWNNATVSTGTYVMRLEGTRIYLNQRLLLMR